MKQSTDRILTTHVGSLARPHSLLDIMKEREFDRPYDAEALDREIAEAVKDRVRQQVENGIDIVADGEMSKVSFLGYVKDRLGGFEVDANARRSPRRGRPSSTCSPSTTPTTSRSTRRRSAR
jgi:5-methyltetrahydropteroyltriglutamate--homocysteine methyltransferase